MRAECLNGREGGKRDHCNCMQIYSAMRLKEPVDN